MSKTKRIENLAGFIGLNAAHTILMRITNKPETKHHLEVEAKNYEKLSVKYAVGNWNREDIEMIKKSAAKRCRIKLSKYPDIRYDDVEEDIETIMNALGIDADA